MIQITPAISLDENELHMYFIHASGPGGQNVNKVATAVQLRFNAAASPSLPEDVRQRLLALAHGRTTTAGEIIIEARRHRTQEANRQAALERLVELIQRAAYKPPVRHKTRPTLASREKRLEIKRRRSGTKSMRRNVGGEE